MQYFRFDFFVYWGSPYIIWDHLASVMSWCESRLGHRPGSRWWFNSCNLFYLCSISALLFSLIYTAAKACIHISIQDDDVRDVKFKELSFFCLPFWFKFLHVYMYGYICTSTYVPIHMYGWKKRWHLTICHCWWIWLP